MIVIVRLIAYPKETTQEEERGGVCEVQEWLPHPLRPLPRIDGVVKLSSTPTLPLPYTLASSRVLVGDLRRPRSPRAREANCWQPNLIETQTNIVPANIVVSIRACRSSSLLILHLDDLEELCHLHRLARVLIFERQLNFQRLWHISLLLPGLYHCGSGLLFAVMCWM